VDDYAAGGASSVTAKCLSNTPRVGLHRRRMDREQVIAEKALLLVTDHVGLQHLLAALRARHHERHAPPSSMVGGRASPTRS